MKPIVYVRRLGRIPYRKALDIQCPVLLEDYQLNKPEPENSLLLLEHDPVYTIGIRSQPYNHEYVDKLRRELDDHKLQADFVPTNRGGLITFHGPGQLVAYPIINLGDFKESVPNKSVKMYVRNLEKTIIDTLAMSGLEGAHTVPEYPGVWIDGGDRKIAFIGISCKRHVTMHGISINCDCELSWFDHIVSCGIENKAITSIRREFMTVGRSDLDDDFNNTMCPKHGVQHIADAFCSSFARHFDCELRER